MNLWHGHHSTCPFYSQKQAILPNGDTTSCIMDDYHDPGEVVIELTEKDFPTNREWLESLSDEDLAKVIACGELPTNPDSFGQTVSMVKEWFSKPCKYLMEEE